MIRATGNTFNTAATVPGALEPSGTWKTALCLCGSNGSFVGSNISTPYFFNTCKQQNLVELHCHIYAMESQNQTEIPIDQLVKLNLIF